MNGRAYDPILGRFLSHDNKVNSLTNSQSFNLYSYCLNNPLKYIDPTGWTDVNPNDLGDGGLGQALSDAAGKDYQYNYQNSQTNSFDMFGNSKYDANGNYIAPNDRATGATGASYACSYGSTSGQSNGYSFESYTEITEITTTDHYTITMTRSGKIMSGPHYQYSTYSYSTIVKYNGPRGGNGQDGTDGGNIGFKINGAVDKTVTLTDASVYGAQKLAGVAAKDLVKLSALKTLGTITGVISVYENGSKFLDNPSKNWWNGVEVVGQVGFMVLGGEEAQIIYNVSTLAIDATIEVMKRKQSEQ